MASLQLQFSFHLVWGLIMSSAHASVTIVVAGMLLSCSFKESAKDSHQRVTSLAWRQPGVLFTYHTV